MKGPANSIVDGGDWAAGLQKTRAYEQLLMDIVLGRLPPMSVLDEKALAAAYASGLASVRDALGRLALEGLVVRRPRVGTIVAPMDVREIRQAFEVRDLLEPRTAALAARNATADDLAAISSAFDGAEAAIEARDFRAMLQMDRNFHRAVALATKNLVLARIVTNLQNAAVRFWIWQMEKQTPAEQMHDVKLHRALAAAIAERDMAAAEAAAAKLVGVAPSSQPG